MRSDTAVPGPESVPSREFIPTFLHLHYIQDPHNPAVIIIISAALASSMVGIIGQPSNGLQATGKLHTGQDGPLVALTWCLTPNPTLT